MPSSPYNTHREWCPVIASVWRTKSWRKYICMMMMLLRHSSSPGLLWFPCLPWNPGNHPRPEIRQKWDLPAIVWLFHYIAFEGISLFPTRRHFSLHFTGISLSLQTVCIYWTCGSQDVCCPLLAGEWNNIHVCNKLCLAVGINHCMLHLPALYIYHLHQLVFLLTKYINIHLILIQIKTNKNVQKFYKNTLNEDFVKWNSIRFLWIL